MTVEITPKIKYNKWDINNKQCNMKLKNKKYTINENKDENRNKIKVK